MELWQHALYALAIVTMICAGWVAWLNERDKRRVAERDESAASSKAATQELKAHDWKRIANNYMVETHQLTEERDRAEVRAQSAEQSSRSYKGHNKRLRSENRALKERIAELEGGG